MNNAEKTTREAYMAARKAAYEKGKAEAAKIEAQTKERVAAAETKSEATLTLRKSALAELANQLRGADSLQATIIRRDLKKVTVELRQAVVLRNVQQKADRATIKAVNETSRTRTADEQLRYDARLAKRAEKQAEADKAAAAAAHAAANPTGYQTHNTANYKAACYLLPVAAVKPADKAVLRLADLHKLVVAPNGQLKTQNYAAHGIYNTGNRFGN